MNVFQEMLTTPTAHHILDSGAIYGRAYQRNRTRDFANEPQATLCQSEVSVSVYHHLNACLEEDQLCHQFDPEDPRWLEDHGLFPESEAWNTYNWDNNFDQVLQGQNLTEDYVLLQIHGGCDVRSGYTEPRLFHIRDWMSDYFLLDDCSFTVAPPPCYRTEADWITIDIHGWIGNATIYDPYLSDTVEVPPGFFEQLPPTPIEGVQYACEH